MSGHPSSEDRIAELRRSKVSVFSEREQLDRSLDPRIQVVSSRELRSARISVVVDGEEVSRLVVVDFVQQIGRNMIRMGGIGGVETPEEHRFKGYARILMDNTLIWMRAEGYDTSMLHGVPSFYPKFGYTVAFPRITYTLEVKDAEALAPGRSSHRFVNFNGDCVNAVRRMYHRNNAGKTGRTLRRAGHWKNFQKGSNWGIDASCKVALDSRGRPAGYITYDNVDLKPNIIEAGSMRGEVFPDILRVCIQLVRKERLDSLRFYLPEDDDFIHFLQPAGMKKEVVYLPDCGAMVRMIRIQTALEKIAPELASRTHGRGCLNIRTNLDAVRLEWKNGRMKIGEAGRKGPTVRMPQWALAQLLYGHRPASSLAAEGVIKASSRAVAILEELFPLQPHFQFTSDHF